MRCRSLKSIVRAASVICLGTADYGSGVSEQAACRLLDRFVELGGNFLDTAHIYGAWDRSGANRGSGNSEVVIGRWMQANGCREEIVIGTKGGHPDFESGKSCMDAAAIRRHLEESLERLHADHIDIYWLHRDDRSLPVEDILGGMAEHVEAGTIGVLGCSNWRIDRMEEARRVAGRCGLPLLDAAQISWSLARAGTPVRSGRFGETVAMDGSAWDFFRRHGVPVAAYSSQAHGFFAARYDGMDFSSSDFPKPGLIREYGSDLNYRRRAAACELAARKGCSANQIALSWLLHQPFPVFPIVGPRSPKQLEDSAGAAEVVLNEEEMKMLGQQSSL